MTVKELREILSRHDDGLRDDDPVSVLLDIPSIGPSANTHIKSAHFGFDWDKGLLFKTVARIAPKTDDQDVFEQARDLLIYIATKPNKKESYEIRTAKRILERRGFTEEKFEQCRRLYHRTSP